MVETAPIAYCKECKILWGAKVEAECADASHTHSEFQLHLHRAPVRLADGTEVVPVSFDPNDPYARENAPDFGLYLDERWSPPWPHEHLAWPDFGLPTSTDELRSKLTQLLERSRRGERVEVGCLGGHGRTGTALACLATLTGTPPADAVAWARSAHCDKAVETSEQAAFVIEFGD